MVKLKLILDAKRLIEARVCLGFTEKDVRTKLHLAKSTVWKAFKVGECGLVTARRIAKLLGLDLADLWLDARTLQPWRVKR